MKRILSIFVMVIIVIFAFAVTPKKKGVHQLPPINIEASVDSALIMADNYATALATTPEMAPTRLNMFKSFCSSKPQVVQDSICNRIFDFFAQYIESDKTERAIAFKNCYEAVASADNAHRGPLYAMELQEAIVNSDTIRINQYLPLLEEYASRMNFDYDDEINSAKVCKETIKNRKPINEELVGVWVSDEIMSIPLIASMYGFSVGKVFNIMGGNGYAAATREVSEKDAIMTLNFIAFGYDPVKGYSLVGFGDNNKGICMLQNNECEKYNLNINKNKVNSKSSKRNPNWMYETIHMQTDNDARWLYALWGNEQLKKNNPEFSALLRQSIQQTQAMVAGHYSRSKYNFGDRVAANAIASGFSAFGNWAIDHFSVSKEKIYSAEVNLQMQHKNKLKGRLDVVYTEVRSDTQIPKMKERNNEVTYYRWTPDDNVFFLTTLETFVPLFEPSKLEMNRMKEITKNAKKYWESLGNKNGNGNWFYLWFNDKMLQKLKNNAGDSQPVDIELKNILEI